MTVAAPARLVSRWADRYLDALLREHELNSVELPGQPVSFFYGGGTPTMLPAADLARLHERLAAGVNDAEVSVEANPETVGEAYLSTLRRAGFNRLSLGLQAWQDELLAALGRRATRADFLAAFGAARQAGFDNLSVDLMYGLPGQTLAMWRETLDGVLALEPEHVSCYSLQIEPGTVFGAHPPVLPGEEAEIEMYEFARQRLAAAGFTHYEISNWAKPGYRCRHNLLYWENAEWLGLGIGAAGQVGSRRWTNGSSLATYCASLEAGQLPPAAVVAREERGDTMMLGLRLVADGVERAAFQHRFGVAVDDAYGDAVRRLVAEGLLVDHEARLRLSERGLLLANRVCAAFV